MKKIIKSALFLLCGLSLFTACDDDRESNPCIVQPQGFVLNKPAYSSSVIDLSKSTNVKLTWSQPNYGGFPVAAGYVPQVSLDGNFTVSAADEAADATGQTRCNYVDLAVKVYECSMAINNSQLAAAITSIAKWETTEDVPSVQDVYIRMKSEFATMQPTYSNVVKLTVVPIFVEPVSFAEFIYEIGNESGWATVHPLRSPNLDGIYQGYYYMDGEFKFRPNEGDWNGDWEYAEEEGVFEDNGGANFPALAAGFYEINADMTGEKYTYSTRLVENISIIGTVNGNWDTDTDLTFNTATGAWEVTTTLAAGKMKFRMNHDWAVSWGGADGDASNYGNLTQNGGTDLDVAAGTYLVQLFISYEGNNRVVLTPQ